MKYASSIKAFGGFLLATVLDMFGSLYQLHFYSSLFCNVLQIPLDYKLLKIRFDISYPQKSKFFIKIIDQYLLSYFWKSLRTRW